MEFKPNWLWSWEHVYQFDNHSYHYVGAVSDLDIADFLGLKKTKQNLLKINKEWISYERALQDNKDFDKFLSDRYYEEASRDYYTEEEYQ